jgi:hypothetical protein
MPQKYRKKPVVIEAIQLTPRNAMRDLEVDAAARYISTLENRRPPSHIETLEGDDERQRW